MDLHIDLATVTGRARLTKSAQFKSISALTSDDFKDQDALRSAQTVIIIKGRLTRVLKDKFGLYQVNPGSQFHFSEPATPKSSMTGGGTSYFKIRRKPK